MSRRSSTPQGRILLRFGEIEELSRRFDVLQDLRARGDPRESKLAIIADWPAIFLACLRREIVVLPLEPTMGEQERLSALQACRAAGLMTSPERPIVRLGTGARIDWKDRRARPPQTNFRHDRRAARGSFPQPSALCGRDPNLRHDGDLLGRPEFRRDPVVAFLWLQQSGHAIARPRSADGHQ